MSRRIEEIEAEMMQRQCRRVQDFRYALRKFRIPCEISLCTIFRNDSEISLPYLKFAIIAKIQCIAKI